MPIFRPAFNPHSSTIFKPLFNPEVVSSFDMLSYTPYAWFDASDAATITESGGDVSQWNDKSGNAKNVAQAGATLKPKTGISTVNTLNAIVPDGSDDYMDVLDAGLIGLSGFSIFAVVKNRAGALVDGQIFHSNLFSPDDFRPCLRYDAVGFAGGAPNCFKMGMRTSAGNGVLESSANSALLNTTQLLNYDWQSGTGSAFYINNSLDTPSYNDTPSTGTIVETGHISIGKGISPCFFGDICEIVIFGASKSTEDRTAIANHLISKWGIV